MKNHPQPRAPRSEAVEQEEAEWAAAIARAKSAPRPAIDQQAWQERIARAARRPTPAASDASQSLREKIERVAARAGTLLTPARTPAVPAGPSEEEEAQWRAAIHKAKTGNA